MNPKNIIILAVLVFTAAFVFFLVKPQFSEVGELSDRKLRQEDNLRIVKEKLATTKTAILQFKEIATRDIELIDLALPTEEDSPDLFFLVDSIASSAGLAVGNIEVAAEEVSDISIIVTASGSYESLKGFVLGAQKSLRIFDVSSIDLSIADTNEAGFTSLDFEIMMKTHFE